MRFAIKALGAAGSVYTYNISTQHLKDQAEKYHLHQDLHM